jgi:flagellar biosynthetic protein FlhB
MTKKEVKDEQKLNEGDPHVRARIRSIQREMATRRMMDDVPESTVVVTNPTHYAVALRYDRDDANLRFSAPVVVAKGVDHLAQRIKKVASENGVILYEDVALARTLYAQVEIGQEIPQELYSAVVAILGYVYRIQRASA